MHRDEIRGKHFHSMKMSIKVYSRLWKALCAQNEKLFWLVKRRANGKREKREKPIGQELNADLMVYGQNITGEILDLNQH